MDHRATALRALGGRTLPEGAPWAEVAPASAYDVTVSVAGGATRAADALFNCTECVKTKSFACFKSVVDVRKFLMSGLCQKCQDILFGR